MPNEEAVAAVVDLLDGEAAERTKQRMTRPLPATCTTACGLASTKVEIGVDDSGTYLLVTIQTDAGPEPAEYVRVAEEDKEQWIAASRLIAFAHELALKRRGFTYAKE